MYQAQNYNPFSKINKCIKKEFEFITNLFEEEFIKLDKTDDRKYDLSKSYRINWACIHNNPKFVGRKCKIIQKNNKIALVLVELNNGEQCTTLQAIYRLEDISIIN